MKLRHAAGIGLLAGAIYTGSEAAHAVSDAVTEDLLRPEPLLVPLSRGEQEALTWGVVTLGQVVMLLTIGATPRAEEQEA